MAMARASSLARFWPLSAHLSTPTVSSGLRFRRTPGTDSDSAKSTRRKADVVGTRRSAKDHRSPLNQQVVRYRILKTIRSETSLGQCGCRITTLWVKQGLALNSSCLWGAAMHFLERGGSASRRQPLESSQTHTA